MVRRTVVAAAAACLLLIASVAADQTASNNLTGNWNGSMVPTAQPDRQNPVLLILKQEGSTLTGSGGPNADQRFPIKEGKVTTVKGVTSATILVELPSGGTVSFDLKLVESKLKGAVKLARDGQEQAGTIELARTK